MRLYLGWTWHYLRLFAQKATSLPLIYISGCATAYMSFSASSNPAEPLEHVIQGTETGEPSLSMSVLCPWLFYSLRNSEPYRLAAAGLPKPSDSKSVIFDSRQDSFTLRMTNGLVNASSSLRSLVDIACSRCLCAVPSKVALLVQRSACLLALSW
jgi:hypothetical protein